MNQSSTKNAKKFASPATLMIQGTTSDAGKSILVTALCRILARNNISVAPFKSQNMALNSAVTKEGGEIGRAQAVQAEACYLEPSVTMNPVLLKPNSDLGAQVIVNGNAIGNMQAQAYHHYKPQLLNTVVDAHKKLQSEYNVIIVEGAGSPAEINLREHDIANMGFAEAIDCSVIIVADIDRGGVFAHLYGTYELLRESEKKRVQGFVINRFRGDVSLLEPGLKWLEDKTGVPTLGVIPYISNLHIEAEDSLATKNQLTADKKESYQRCKIVVPMYPRASNHTDFDALRIHPQIDCQFQKEVSEFSGADIIILPGSKHVRGDLQWLRDMGWEKAIKRHLRLGGKVIGICGGYQMLGHWVHDPNAIESDAGSSMGLGLLDMETTLTEKKTLRNVSGYMLATASKTTRRNNTLIKGYEIHAGISSGPALKSPLLQLAYNDNESSADNKAECIHDGAINTDYTVMGSYVHGLFDETSMLEYCLNWGLPKNNDSKVAKNFNYQEYKNAEIDRLADVVEVVMPLELILDLLRLDKNIKGRV